MGKTTVYFDGACYLCSAEIRHYEKKDKTGVLRLVDISSPEFQAETEGLDPVKVQQWMHVRDSRGQLRLGVDAFIAIWESLPQYRWLSVLASMAIPNLLLRLGYVVFAKVRPYLPRRKTASCENGSCRY